MKLLITGSRVSTKDMHAYARKAVRRAGSLGWTIIVGDADGVDKAVLLACKEFKVPVRCYGITKHPRNPFGVTVETMEYTRVEGSYLDRDMVMAAACDRCLAIWNGTSRGTKYTFDCVVKLGKPADMRNFEEWKPNS